MAPALDPEFSRLLTESHRRIVGTPLIPAHVEAADAAAWLYESAPFAVVAHDTAPDPVFIYGNRRAQDLFGYDWDEFTALPSRLSAEAPERSERQAFLERVTRDGFVDDYRGIRVSRTGARFWIEQVTVWQLLDPAGRFRGQAAMIPVVKPVVPFSAG
jgi:PAS domain-containing protein